MGKRKAASVPVEYVIISQIKVRRRDGRPLHKNEVMSYIIRQFFERDDPIPPIEEPRPDEDFSTDPKKPHPIEEVPILVRLDGASMQRLDALAREMGLSIERVAARIVKHAVTVGGWGRKAAS